MTFVPNSLFERGMTVLAAGGETAAPGGEGITVWEHFLLFMLLSLLVSLVYSGLRQEDLKKIVRLGFKRFLVFINSQQPGN